MARNRELPKYDFSVNKSMFGITKSVQEFQEFAGNSPGPNYVCSIAPTHYLISALGGPVQIFSQNSSMHKTLDTAKKGC
jgi:hypothetical protein